MTVEVKLLHYKFRFRKLSWREEFHLQISPGKNPTRVILSHALENVSGLPVRSVTEAAKIFAVMPLPVVSRVYRIYKGLLPSSKRFETAGLYRAPESADFIKKVEVDEEAVEPIVDETMRRMESQFSRQELEEAAEVDRQIIRGSNLRGAVKLNPEKIDAQ